MPSIEDMDCHYFEVRRETISWLTDSIAWGPRAVALNFEYHITQGSYHPRTISPKVDDDSVERLNEHSLEDCLGRWKATAIYLRGG
jgi:hypothetical protein